MFMPKILMFLGLFCSCKVLAVTLQGPTSRIIGGSDAHLPGSPFTLAINVQTSNSRYFCGGALIGQQWVLTAGQCIDGAILFTIRLGAEALEEEDSNRVTLATSTYFLHPDYNPNTLENDIGLIELRMPITFTEYIKPIDYLSNITMGLSMYVLGWGQTSDDDSSLADRLQITWLQPLSNEECRMWYGDQIKESMVCMAGSYNEGICHGDTGGPLVERFPYGQNGLIGIASFLSGNGCETAEPSGFTRVFPYVEWIKSITGLDIPLEP